MDDLHVQRPGITTLSSLVACIARFRKLGCAKQVMIYLGHIISAECFGILVATVRDLLITAIILIRKI